MSNTAAPRFRIREMRPAELEIAADWAAGEGWNPGLADASCYAAIDPAGFLIGDYEGEAAAIISNVIYSGDFAFLGFFIVRPDLRGRGLGLQIWRSALAHSGARAVGLDGVAARQASYARSGFAFAYNNIRYGGICACADWCDRTVPLSDVPFDALSADDARCFPADRPAFLRAWIGAPGHVGRALVREGRLAGWGVIRPCRKGRKIGPLYASDRDAAETIFSALASSGEGEVFIDVPEPNRSAVELAAGRGLEPVFETARMYSGPVRPVALDGIFGVASFEVG